ncbi:MAG: type II toxin-antitoxin system VapB family antitoxin [Nitrosospira sp.]
MLTRVFKSGNSLAVRIPKELGFSEPNQDVEIERQGNALVIRPVEKRSLAGLMDKFSAFPTDFMAEEREFHEEKERQGW